MAAKDREVIQCLPSDKQIPVERADLKLSDLKYFRQVECQIPQQAGQGGCASIESHQAKLKPT
jgi:hypothetical protein